MTTFHHVGIDDSVHVVIRPDSPYPPLDPTGALATLLVVLNVVPLADAANAIHEEQAHLVAEAEAWSLGV